MNIRKTAFVTGANRGIGKKVTESLLKNNFDLICSVRSITQEFRNFVESCKVSDYQKITILEFSIDDYNQTKKEVQKLYKEKVVLDVLVNNAGLAHGGLFEMTSVKKIKEVFEINFFSQIHLTQLLLRLLKKSEAGSIINIGSISGILGDPGTIAYGSSKASFMYATKVMSNELSRYNIRVNCIAPSITDTGMSAEMDEKASSDLLQRSYQKRKCTTDEISDLVLFLCSGKAYHLNGQIIRMDGGMSG